MFFQHYAQIIQHYHHALEIPDAIGVLNVQVQSTPVVRTGALLPGLALRQIVGRAPAAQHVIPHRVGALSPTHVIRQHVHVCVCRTVMAKNVEATAVLVPAVRVLVMIPVVVAEWLTSAAVRQTVLVKHAGLMNVVVPAGRAHLAMHAMLAAHVNGHVCQMS